jgi:hypothetical protein
MGFDAWISEIRIMGWSYILVGGEERLEGWNKSKQM